MIYYKVGINGIAFFRLPIAHPFQNTPLFLLFSSIPLALSPFLSFICVHFHLSILWRTICFEIYSISALMYTTRKKIGMREGNGNGREKVSEGKKNESNSVFFFRFHRICMSVYISHEIKFSIVSVRFIDVWRKIVRMKAFDSESTRTTNYDTFFTIVVVVVAFFSVFFHRSSYTQHRKE